MKAKFIILTAVSLVAGYALGIIIGFPNTSGNKAKGDVSKVSMFRKGIAETQVSDFEMKLLSDTLAFKEESLTKDILVCQIKEFANLVDSSILVAGNIEELQNDVNVLKNLKTLSENASKAADAANTAFEGLENGAKENKGISYEQASNNLIIAYTLVSKQVQAGKKFAIAADEYYEKHNELVELAQVRDSWATFCSENALLNSDQDEIEYWASDKMALGESKLAQVLVSHEDVLGAFYRYYFQQKGTDSISQKLLSNREDALGAFYRYVSQGAVITQKSSEALCGKMLSSKLLYMESEYPNFIPVLNYFVVYKTSENISNRLDNALASKLE